MSGARGTVAWIGVIGAGECDAGLVRLAEQVGEGIARAGAALVCGGMGGVMEAACKGAKAVGGLTVGILPGSSRHEANPFVDIPVATGMAEARNLAIVKTADVLIAVGGSYGTLSEIGFALKMDKRVIGLRTWDVPGIEKVDSASQAVGLALKKLPQE